VSGAPELSGSSESRFCSVPSPPDFPKNPIRHSPVTAGRKIDANQTWQAQIRRSGYPALAKSFATRADAVAWAREKERSIDRAELPPCIKELKRLTVADLLRRYELEITPRKRGAVFERSRIRQLWLIGCPRQASTISRARQSPSIATTGSRWSNRRQCGGSWSFCAMCPADFSPELVTIMKSALDAAVHRIDRSHRTPATKAKMAHWPLARRPGPLATIQKPPELSANPAN
jgi:hypothetical protein